MVSAFYNRAFEAVMDNQSRSIDGKQIERKILGALESKAYDLMNVEIDELIKKINDARKNRTDDASFFEKYIKLSSPEKTMLINKLLSECRKAEDVTADIDLHMKWVMDNQHYNEGGPSEPESEWMYNMHASFAEILCPEDYDKLRYYTAVDSMLDFRYGIDAFFVLMQKNGSLTLTLDCTIGKSKNSPRADLVITWSETDNIDDFLKDDDTFYLSGSKPDPDAINKELNRLEKQHKKNGGVKSLFRKSLIKC